VHRKRFVIVLLTGLNAVLMTALWMGADSPSAYAQPGGRPGNLTCVTAKAAGQSFDLLYVLDVTSRKLFAFYPSSGRNTQLVAAPPRDLVKDFNR